MSGSEKTGLRENDALSVRGRSRSKLSREIVLALLIKLVLIVVIKFTFFNDSISKAEVAQRMDAVFGSQQAAPDSRTSSDSQRENHD